MLSGGGGDGSTSSSRYVGVHECPHRHYVKARVGRIFARTWGWRGAWVLEVRACGASIWEAQMLVLRGGWGACAWPPCAYGA